MAYINNKSTILPILFVLMTLVSCIDDDYLCAVEDNRFPIDEIPEGIREGYSINLVASLAKLGGAAATAGDPLEEYENYIDPEKFRVLFFDHNDKFLFESKSRWVKKIDPSSSNSEWLVSVPVFTYGNDIYDYEYEDENGNKIEVKGDEWNWVAIRKALTEKSFKVAILANRPELDYYPSFSDTKDHLPEHWYDNRGPFWYPKDTGKKDVFDLHHCQYDPMYHGKSKTTEKGVTEVGYYDFIMADWDNTQISNDEAYGTMRPKMGATCSWVDWNNKVKPSDYDDDTNCKMTDSVRYTILPDNQHPIPMYGIQKFEAIGDNWIKGTPFNLSNLIASSGDNVDEEDGGRYKKVSLLRSAVRLDLLIPKTYERPDFVSLFYSNIYSRCEPMDVWTPTDQIWEDDHENDCEWNAIMDYGLVDSKNITLGGINRYSNSKENFQKTMSWFYGAWKEKNWAFTNSEGKNLTPADLGIPYPKIFNTCVQRNKMVMCSEKGDVSDLYNDGYWHFVVYTGERNMLDPNTIPLLSNESPNKGETYAYATSWMFKDKKNGDYYCIPIADYSKRQTYAKNCFGPYKVEDIKGNDLPNNKDKGSMYTFGNDLRDYVTERDDMPWPLLRNHIYRITVTGPSPEEITEYDYMWDFTKSLNATSVYNLDMDPVWIKPGGKETMILSYESLVKEKNIAGEPVDLTWGYGTLQRNAGTAYSNGNKLLGTEYTTIKTGNNIPNTLTVPDNKQIRSITFRSNVNEDAPASEKTFSATVKAKSAVDFDLNETKITNTWAEITGGTMYAFNGQSEKKKLIQAQSSTYYFTMTNNNTYFRVELDEALAVGDELSATIYGDGLRGIYISQSETYPEGAPSFITATASKAAVKNCKYIVTADDGLAGATTIYIHRYTGNSTYFGDFTIASTPAPNTRWSEPTEKEMFAWRNSQFTDEYTLSFENNPTQTVTFTSTSTSSNKYQACFVAFVDVENTEYTPYWEYKNPNGEQKANSKYIPELQGLKIYSEGSLYVYEGNPSKIRLTGQTTITFPNLKDGATITIISNDSENKISSGNSNMTMSSEPVPDANGKYTSVWTVSNPGSEGTVPIEIKFDGRTNGIEFYEIRIKASPSANSTRSANSRGSFGVKSEDLHSKSLRF